MANGMASKVLTLEIGGVFSLLVSGQGPIVTQSKAVATPQQESQQQILAFMGCGLITMMDRIHPTVIPTTLLMPPRCVYELTTSFLHYHIS